MKPAFEDMSLQIPAATAEPEDYTGEDGLLYCGKCAKIPLASYATKLNRRKLLKAYCDKEPLAKMVFLPEETELANPHRYRVRSLPATGALVRAEDEGEQLSLL